VSLTNFVLICRSTSSVYSDRYIPSRVNSLLDDVFEHSDSNSSHSIVTNPSNSNSPFVDHTNENRSLMSTLLRSELLGQPHVSSTGGIIQEGSKDSPQRPSVLKYRSGIGSTTRPKVQCDFLLHSRERLI
jgi:hypothetical protein